jgi:MFS superfamily sulfate permease-like transporter
MLGIRTPGASLPDKVVEVATGLPGAGVAAAVSACVIALVLGLRRVSRRIPGALIAVVAAIAAGSALDLPRRGVAVLGPVPGGLPFPSFPGVSLADIRALIPTATAMCVVILAQSAATARAYAARYDEQLDTDSDLVGLAGANVGAALTGSFVVNGSPTKTQMVDEAGGRSQLAQLAAAATVLVVVAALTGLLDTRPLAALASVVFLIGVDLVDVAGMRRIYAVRRAEFAVAALTALTVVLLGVQTGIAVAVVASIIDHLRHSYDPHNAVLVKSPAGHWQSAPVTAGARTEAGLVVYRFGSGLYFANAARFAEDVTLLTRSGPTLAWFCLDGAAIGDVDYSAAAVLARVQTRLRVAGVRVVLANINESVAAQLERYGLVAALGPGACFDTAGEVLEAYRKATAGG